MMKRLLQLFFALVLSTLPLMPIATVSAASPNLIPNPSVETASPTNTSLPQSWVKDKYGTNTSTLTYKSGGRTGTKSLYVKTTNYTDGDAKWEFEPVAVSPNTTYQYSEYYKANIRTELLVAYIDANGDWTFQWLKGANASSASWKQLSASFTTPSNAASVTVLHLLDGVGWLQTDDFSLVSTVVTVPTVAISSPSSGSVLSGTATVSAAASDGNGIAGVQFKLDGNNLGAEDTTAPYQVNWDTKLVSNGSHTLSAVARNTAGATSTSTNVGVTVQNTVVVPVGGVNVVPNPSLENASSDPSKPASWSTNKSKTNNAAFTYQSNGHTGNKSAKVQITSYTSGDAYWSFPAQGVTGGKTYEFSDWYQSNVDTEIYAHVIMLDGSEQWLYIGTAWHSTGWNRFYTQFTMPAGAQSAELYHTLFSVGYLVTDDYQLDEYTPVGFNQGLVSITFDDSIRSTYTYGLPALNKYGFKSTQYMLSGVEDDPYYMDVAMMQLFKNGGHEIAAHSVTHPSLIKLIPSEVTTELSQCQSTLLTWLGVKPTNFATPHGEYNAEVLAQIKQYYGSHRSVDVGFNSKDNFDIYNIKVQNVVRSTSVAQINAWLSAAKSQKTWLVLVYHATDPDTTIPDANWNTTPTELDAQFAAIKASGIAVKTVEQSLNEIKPQL